MRTSHAIAHEVPDRRSPGAPTERDPGDEHACLLVRRTAAGDRHAFTELFDATVGPLFDDACSLLPEPRAGSVIVQTFVEVWRLARYHADPDADAIGWIRRIAARRIAEACHEAPPPAAEAPPSGPLTSGPLPPDVLAEMRVGGAAMELARLLGRDPGAVGPQDPQVLVAELIACLPAPLDDNGDPTTPR